MRKILIIVGVLLLSGLALSEARATAVGGCTPTGFMRDNINLTAKVINPTGTFSGDVNATGCNIGIFYGSGAKGALNGASVHGANYFGIVRYGANVTITDTVVYQIGEQPFNGSQHGSAIYCAADSPRASKGDITNNLVYAYQKGGIVMNGTLCSGAIANNTVIGNGPVNYIAQNGIQAAYGSSVSVTGNYVFGNSYTGANEASSAGILLIGGACFGQSDEANVSVTNNTVVGNDIGIYSGNFDVNCDPVSTKTKNMIESNLIQNNADNNTTGDGPSTGYQAGIADSGDLDHIESNQICGFGYSTQNTATFVALPIDTTATNGAVVHSNQFCGAAIPAAGPKSAGKHHKPNTVN